MGKRGVVACLLLMACVAAVLALTPPWAQGRGHAEHEEDEGPARAAEVRAARAVQARHEAALLKQPGVQGVGVGLMEDGRTVGIHVYVQRDRPRPALPADLDGFPVRVIESGPFVAHHGPCNAPNVCHAQVYPLPVPMGVSTGNVNGVFAGTLGFRCNRIGNSSEVGYITNNHVAAASGANLCQLSVNPENLPAFGVDQCQPGRLDAPGSVCVSPPIGDLVQAVPLVMGTEFLNTVDAAFVKSHRGCVSKTILDLGPPLRKAQFPKLGSTVWMSGRTSGRKRNQVVAVNVTADVTYDAGTCGVARFVNQAITSPLDSLSASLPGDSGAPVVRITSTGRVPVGLNFAGDGFFGVINPMPLVLNALGVEIDTASDEPGAACPF